MKKILIIEDEKLIRKYLHQSIDRIGSLDVSSTGNGHEAIKLLRENKFHLVFCDVMLEDITAFDIFEELILLNTISNLRERFVFITAYTSNQILDKIKSLNCRMIKKPFSNIEEFCNIINSYEDLS